MAMDDGVALNGILEVSLVVLMAGKLGPSCRTLGPIVACIRTVMPIQCRHGIFNHFWRRSSGFDEISSHGSHGEVFAEQSVFRTLGLYRKRETEDDEGS